MDRHRQSAVPGSRKSGEVPTKDEGNSSIGCSRYTKVAGYLASQQLRYMLDLYLQDCEDDATCRENGSRETGQRKGVMLCGVLRLHVGLTSTLTGPLAQVVKSYISSSGGVVQWQSGRVASSSRFDRMILLRGVLGHHSIALYFLAFDMDGMTVI